ncbi:AAA family ATPase [Tahibacter caeni]|uniref:AAA family ATPase n=1 Tax=Tahibacter caeni TaxID=1453545 RepID=UPI00214860C8|nr:AAA family ATPase [Tahibacter caeni]
MTAITPDSPLVLPSELRTRLDRAVAQVNSVVLGKAGQVNHAFVSLIAGGHLLIEDLPGVGKTTLAHALAATLDLSFQRVQFTSDLLPSDIIGVSIFERDGQRFEFHPGPLFAQLVLADEINRATPKTQSALLEAMAEQQVTVDGRTHALPAPFFVVATQNPLDLAGTYPLPDSQLDRFMLRISLDYPSREAERELLTSTNRQELIATLAACMNAADIQALRQFVGNVVASPALIDYLQALIGATRSHADVRIGLSPRAGLALLAAARAQALLHGRGYVLPEDVQAVFVPVTAHRLTLGGGGQRDRVAVARELLAGVAVR